MAELESGGWSCEVTPSCPNARFRRLLMRPAAVCTRRRSVLITVVLWTFFAASLFRNLVCVMPKSLNDRLQPPKLAMTLRMQIASLTRQFDPLIVPLSSLCHMKTRSISASYEMVSSCQKMFL
jgi:hypothetical protein